MIIQRLKVIRALICLLVLLCFGVNAHAQDKPVTFEEALEQSVKLSEYYEWADSEEQQQLRDDWQAVHDRWKTMGEEEKTEINVRREERKKNWENMSSDDMEKLEKIRKRFLK